MKATDYDILSTTGAEPVTVERAKEHLRVVHTKDDEYIAGLVSAAREMAEAFCGKVFVAQTVQAFFECWPHYDRTFHLPVGRFSSLTSVDYIDANSNAAIIAIGKFYTDGVSPRPRLKLKETETFPSINPHALNPISITYDVEAPAKISNLVQQGIMEHVSDMYVNRTPVNIARDGRIAITIPAPIMRLYGPDRVRA